MPKVDRTARSEHHIDPFKGASLGQQKSAASDAEFLWLSTNPPNENVFQGDFTSLTLLEKIAIDPKGSCGAAFDQSVLHRVLPSDEVEVETMAVFDEDVLVMRLAGPGVTKSGGIADAGKTVDVTIYILMGAESVVAAFNGSDVFVDQVSLGTVDIKSVVVDMGAGNVFDREPRTALTLNYGTAALGVPNLGGIEILAWGEF